MTGWSTRRKFSGEEDALLQKLVLQLGSDNWKAIAAIVPGRTARQCRERYRYYLEPTLNKNTWAEEEDRLLIVKFTEMGPKWAQIAYWFANRTPVDLKNRLHMIQRTAEKGVKAEEHEEGYVETTVRLPSIETLLNHSHVV